MWCWYSLSLSLEATLIKIKNAHTKDHTRWMKNVYFFSLHAKIENLLQALQVYCVSAN